VTAVICSNCGREYPAQGLPYRCPLCGGVYDFGAPLVYAPGEVKPDLPRMWRYRETFGLPEDAPVVTLGEGSTPLITDEAFGRKVAFKLEYLNPTGSYKDRATCVTASFLLNRGIREVVEDSSGNAGASLAGYAARAGIKARIFVPAYASGPKRKQIEAYGADLVPIDGPRSAAAEAVRQEAETGAVYASHAYLPFGMAGVATIAYELFEQIGGAPGTVIAPAGHGSLLLGIMRGFEALANAGLIRQTPAYIGVQAAACAPIWAVFATGAMGLSRITEGETLAEGVRVRHPMRADAMLKSMVNGKDRVIAVEETRILPAREQLARRGFYVEPTSAIVWEALEQMAGELAEPVVLILSGSGYKYNQ
jgi:threonine synthase